MDQQIASRLEADLFLLHAPSVYDFRDRDDMLFAYLSDSDGVNITSIYEMYPIGWFSIKQRLADHGFDTKIVNVASLMLMHPDLDVRRLLGRLEAPIFGFDLHWMTQCNGAIELAALLKEVHPDALTIFGGISATYYASQLIGYPSVDVVVQGYDTLEPLTELVTRVRQGSRDFRSIPNLLYKSGGEVEATGFTHKPATGYNDVRNDWSYYRVLPYEVCQAILDTIAETRQLLGEMERAILLDGTLPAALRDEIRSYNRKILAYSSDQIIPVRRPFGGRWFDDVTVPQQMIEDILAIPAGR